MGLAKKLEKILELQLVAGKIFEIKGLVVILAAIAMGLLYRFRIRVLGIPSQGPKAITTKDTEVH
jgi:hypothetical protein